MTIYTDNPTHVGKHTFELSGCGVAPFTLVDVIEAHGGCAHCGRRLATLCVIQDANGRRFDVGTGCVTRTKDRGLIRAHKNSPQVRAIKRAKAAFKDEKICVEIRAAMVRLETELRSRPHPYGMDGLTEYDYANFILTRGGAQGHRFLLNYLSQPVKSDAD